MLPCLTHFHKDHSRGAADLMKCGIDVYASSETILALGLSGHRAHTISHKGKFTIGTWTVLPLEAEHDIPGALMFLLRNSLGEKFLFATDTFYIRYKFPALNGLAIECNNDPVILKQNIEEGLVPSSLGERLMQSHFSIDDVLDFLK